MLVLNFFLGNDLVLGLVGADGAQGEFGGIDVQIEVLVASKVEGLLDVVAVFGANLKVGKGHFLELGPDPFGRDLPGIMEVGLVAEEDDDGLVLLVVVAEVEPLVEVFEGFLVSGYSEGYL